jgi:GntR family transcriptional regulator
VPWSQGRITARAWAGLALGRVKDWLAPGRPEGWRAGLGVAGREPCDYDKTIMGSSSNPIGQALDPGDLIPLHEQAAAQIRRAIAEGQARRGERLPPAMDLAAVLGVNRNTVLRALRLLREEGLVEFRRGRGVTVTGTPELGTVLAQARELLAQAQRYGYDREELAKLITDLP